MRWAIAALGCAVAIAGLIVGLVPVNAAGRRCGSAFTTAPMDAAPRVSACGEALSPWLYVATALIGVGVVAALVVLMVPGGRGRVG